MSETTTETSEQRGRTISEEEYLGHLAYAYAASPADTPEESVAKALLEIACERLGRHPQDVVNAVLAMEPGGRLLAPWPVGNGVPAGLMPIPSEPAPSLEPVDPVAGDS